MSEGNIYTHHKHSRNDLHPPEDPESLHRKGGITLDRKMKHPLTPLSPSARSIETLISETLPQHKRNNNDSFYQDTLLSSYMLHEKLRPRSLDSTLLKEYGLNDFQNYKSYTKSESVIDDLKKNITQASHQKNSNSVHYANKQMKNVNIDLNKVKLSSEKSWDEKTDLHLAPKTDKGVFTAMQSQEPICVAKNVSYSVKQLPKIQIKSPSISEDIKTISNQLSCPEHDPSLFNEVIQTDTIEGNISAHSHSSVVPKDMSQNSITEPCLEYDNTPEMQVMINSLSPVLLRRNPKKSVRKTGNNYSESSPEIDKKALVAKSVNTVKQSASQRKRNLELVDHKSSESLFMDPKMSQTWHGATSAYWSQIYGPQMRQMMRKLNNLSGGESVDGRQLAVSQENQTFAHSCKTLPSSKSLLDEMHKKFCADQYGDKTDTEVARELVLLRLKSKSPPMGGLGESRAKKSTDINIKMGIAGSGSAASLESSPLLPRVPEKQKIKTSPNMQYPSKPERIERRKTPEALARSKTYVQDEGPTKEEAEIEAVEACRWLKETGFPQYAQMYEDGQFPVDIESVEKDHDFLDKEDIQSLFRRLNTLNKCAIMKIGAPAKKESEDSEDEDQCALSDKWKYQRSSRRWSRKDLISPIIENVVGQPALKPSSSHDSLLADENSSSETGDSPVLGTKMHHTTTDDIMLHKKSLTVDANGNATMKLSPKIRRAASERIKSAKSFLKRVESLKGRRRKPKHVSEISGPVVKDSADMQEKIKHLNCKDISSSNSNKAVSSSDSLLDSRLHTSLDTSANSVKPASQGNTLNISSGNNSMTVDDLNAMGDSSVFLTDSDKSLQNTSTSGALGFKPVSQQNSSSEYDFGSVNYRPGTFPKTLDESMFTTNDSSVRTRSFSYIDDSNEHNHGRSRRRGSCDPRHQLHRISIYDNVPIEEDLAAAQQELDIILSELFQNINGLNRAINGDNAELLLPPSFSAFDNSNISIDADTNGLEHALDMHSDIRDNEVTSGTLSSPDISDHELHVEDLSHDDSAEHIECHERRDSGVGSSLTRANSDRRRYRIRWHSFQKSHRPSFDNRNLPLCNLSAGQMLVLRKLSLLKLTALLEKYSPNRSSWSLTVPRFMKRNKVPDYKDKKVFGVPFTVMIQRTGQALPQCVLHAMRFLRRTSGDALGIFRKSGVRSRIQKLRNDIETDPENIDFEELQAYDVADLVKQYFRELPECLLTNKLSDIFISIFIYVPAELRLEAMQAAIVLMVDENRDVLQSLLLFLSDISQQASEHQMTASNLAVCFGPSLFNIGGLRHPSQTPSPKRNRKNPGIPDARELMEQKAAHECLTVMIQECKKLFTIPAGTISKCRCWDGDPVTLDELNHGTGDGDNQGYTSYIDSCIQGLLKESRDKFRGWVSVPVSSDVDVSYKKVGDGHPLRLWRCTVDVEAPPNEVLNRVLSERQVWDEDLLQWNSIEKLDQHTEVYQFVRNSLAPHPTRDFCVLRSWRSDLPKGACVLISTSIEHPRAELLGGVRAVELASRYLIEPCGTGKSRLTHISRVDIRGHSPDWYKKVYGHICANFMKRISSSFKQTTDGPETKV